MTVVDDTQYEYAGFWLRVGAALIDTVLVSFLTIPLVRMIYGSDDGMSALMFRGTADFLISFVLRSRSSPSGSHAAQRRAR
jgi:hypothetical protein